MLSETSSTVNGDTPQASDIADTPDIPNGAASEQPQDAPEAKEEEKPQMAEDDNKPMTEVEAKEQQEPDEKKPKRLPEILNAYQKCAQNGDMAYLKEFDPLERPPLRGKGDEWPGDDATEEQVEFYVISKMREYKRRIAAEFGPYAEIDLQDILNPDDRIEAIVLRSSKRHSVIHMELNGLIQHAMTLVEEELTRLKLWTRVTTILQGDDPDFDCFTDSDADPELVRCRHVVQEMLNNNVIWAEKMQATRDKISYILRRKRAFLKSLKDRYIAAGYDV